MVNSIKKKGVYVVLCIAEVDRECIYIFQSCGRRR